MELFIEPLPFTILLCPSQFIKHPSEFRQPLDTLAEHPEFGPQCYQWINRRFRLNFISFLKRILQVPSPTPDIFASRCHLDRLDVRRHHIFHYQNVKLRPFWFLCFIGALRSKLLTIPMHLISLCPMERHSKIFTSVKTPQLLTFLFLIILTKCWLVIIFLKGDVLNC